MDTVYYHILDLNIVGKEEEFVPYLYKKEKGWVVDNQNILMDRIMGYDVSELDDSPYMIGNSDLMERVKTITQDEAEMIIKQMDNYK